MSDFLRLVDAAKLKLQFLHLKQDHLKDSDMQNLAKISSLQSVNLESNKITATGLKYLVAMPMLSTIYLDHVPLGPSEIDALGKLKGLKSLSITTSVGGATNVARLKGLLPGCSFLLHQDRTD